MLGLVLSVVVGSDTRGEMVTTAHTVVGCLLGPMITTQSSECLEGNGIAHITFRTGLPKFLLQPGLRLRNCKLGISFRAVWGWTWRLRPNTSSSQRALSNPPPPIQFCSKHDLSSVSQCGPGLGISVFDKTSISRRGSFPPFSVHLRMEQLRVACFADGDVTRLRGHAVLYHDRKCGFNHRHNRFSDIIRGGIHRVLVQRRALSRELARKCY